MTDRRKITGTMVFCWFLIALIWQFILFCGVMLVLTYDWGFR